MQSEAPDDTFEDYPKDFFALSARDIEGSLIEFKTLQGQRAFLVVNVASKCSYTEVSYKGLQALQEKYGEKGLQILAFPCNQFDSQEPWDNAIIKKYVDEHFKIAFPLFEKIDVNGPNTHDVYKFLRGHSACRLAASNTVAPITWNFSKFLVDRDGRVLKMVTCDREPETMERTIRELLE